MLLDDNTQASDPVADCPDTSAKNNSANHEALLVTYREPLIRYLSGVTRDRELAEDIAHDALISVLQKLRQGDIHNLDMLRRFLFQTGYYMFIGWIRRLSNQNYNDENIEETSIVIDTALESRLNDERRELIRKSLDQLSVHRDRELLTRFYLLQDTKQNICNTMSLSNSHFDRVVHRAKNRMKNVLLETDLDSPVTHI